MTRLSDTIKEKHALECCVFCGTGKACSVTGCSNQTERWRSREVTRLSDTIKEKHAVEFCVFGGIGKARSLQRNLMMKSRSDPFERHNQRETCCGVLWIRWDWKGVWCYGLFQPNSLFDCVAQATQHIVEAIDKLNNIVITTTARVQHCIQAEL